MKRRFTFMLAALLLTACCFAPMGMKAASYTITFKTGTGDGSSASTSTACSDIVSAGSDYLTGNLVTATRVYYSGSNGLKLGTANDAGVIKMNLSSFGKVIPTSIVVNAKLYNSSKPATLSVNGSTAQSVSGSFSNLTFTLNSTGNITYLQLNSSKYIWVNSITVYYTPQNPYTVTLSDTGETMTETSAGAGVTLPARSDVSPYTFMGWSTTNNTSETTTSPSTIYTGTYYPTSNVTLYPVYRRFGWSEQVVKWTKTAMASLTAGTYALLTTDGHAFNGSISSGHGGVTSSAFSFTSGVATSAPAGTCEVTFIAVGTSGFKFYNASHGYLYAKAASSGNLAWITTEPSSSNYWRTTGTYWVYELGSKDAYLQSYNNSSFRTYASGSSGSVLEFAKKTTTTNTYYYYISVVTQPVLEPSCEITPDIYEFGNVAIGSTNTATFTVNTENLEGNLTVSIDHTADGFSVSPTSIASTATTTTLTVTFAPAAATADLIATLTISGGGLENNVEALISGKAVQAYTVTFNCNGGMATAPAQQSVLSGGSVTFPTAANLNDEFTFVGWTINPEYVDDEDIFHVGESAAVNSDETYYAVYSHSVFQPTGEKYYELVDEDLNDWSGRYIIVYDMDVVNYNTVYAFNGGRATLDSNFNYVEIDKENDKIEADETANSIAFTVAAKSGGYSIKSASGYYIGVTSYDNGLAQSETDDFVNAFSYGSSSVDITVAVGNNYCTLRFNNSSSTMRFRYYKTGQKDIQLYKYTEAGTTTTARYTRVFLDETATDDIEIVGPSIIPSGSALNASEKNFTNTTVANLVIEEGGQLIHSNNGVQATLQKDITAYTSQKDNYYLMALPFNSYSVGGSPFVTVNGNYDLYTFDGSQTQEEWQQVGTDGAFDPTVGFLYANNVGGTLNLTGKLVPSNEPWEKSLDYDATKTYGAWNLMGNPFACNATISASDFYVIDGEELAATTGVIAPLQGVMVQATAANQSVTFAKAAGAKPAQAVTISIHKNNGVKDMSLRAAIDRARIRFDESQGLEKLQLNPNHTKVYFQQDGKDFAVVRSDSEAEMPVSFKAETRGTYTLSVNTENVEMSYLHLIDNLTGADVDLLATPSYSFEANTRDYANRFKLVFKANTGVEENAATETFAYFNGTNWTVSNVGDATLQVVDMMGRVLSSETISGNANVNINQAAGIYMLRLVNGEKVKVQKVVVR